MIGDAVNDDGEGERLQCCPSKAVPGKRLEVVVAYVANRRQ
jgi:hypothetical protein